MDIIKHGTFNTHSPLAGFQRHRHVTNLQPSDFTPHINLNALYPHVHSEGADTAATDFC